MFKDWETRWRDCRECLEEIEPAARFFWDRGDTYRQSWMTYYGYALGKRSGELDAALRILRQEESFWSRPDNVGAKNALQRSYGNQALILKAWGQLDEAMALHKKEEAIATELGDKNQLQRSYGNQALILQAWGRLDEAMALHKKEEAICLELGNKDGLQISYGNQASILQAWGQLDEAMALHKKEEAICLELGNKGSLQISYGNQALILQALGAAGRGDGPPQEAGSHLPGVGQQGRPAGQLREPGDDPEGLGSAGRGDGPAQESRKPSAWSWATRTACQRSYGNQALILIQQGQLNEALALLQKREAICLDLGNKSSLAYGYWQWVDSGPRPGRPQNREREAAAGPRHLHRAEDAARARRRSGRADQLGER